MSSLRRIPAYAGPGRLFLLEPAANTGRAPVLLTHGTFSDADTMLPLAETLSDAGYPVYVIEWRGRGMRPGQFDFHDLAEGEITEALQSLPSPAHLVAHSGGGLAMTFSQLIPGNRQRTLSLTLIATQGTHLFDAPRGRVLGIRALDLCGRVSGYWPLSLGLGPSRETARLMTQWVRFNRLRRISDRDGRDVFPRLASLDLPVLALSGAADTVIARPDGCAALAAAFGPKATHHCCAKATDGEDFTHSRLVRSRAARQRVWPRITHFLQQVDGSTSGVAENLEILG